MSLGKLVIRGTGKMSLHDRFTQLNYQAPKEVLLSERGGRAQTAPLQRRTPAASRERMREESAPLYQTRHHHEEEPRMSTGNPASRLQRQTEEPSAIGMALRRLNDRTATIAAATRLKNRSIRQRLGVRARLSLPHRNGGGYQNGSSGGYLERVAPPARWGSTESVYKPYLPPRRRWGGGGMRSDARNGRSLGLGVRRSTAGGFRGRRNGRWLGRRGWGVNRGRRGGGGRRGAARRPPPPSREQLDKEIEVYMSGTKSVLDKQLDDYRMEGATES